MPRALPPLALFAALALALTGCAPASKEVAPEPTAVAVPFESEEEALAAAVEAYARFVEVGDSIGRDGGLNAERLEEVATGELLKTSLEGLESWVEKGWRQVGAAEFSDVTLQQFWDKGVIIYLCEDVSAVDVFDATGQSVVSADRPDFYYFQVSFEATDGSLLVSGRERWREHC